MGKKHRPAILDEAFDDLTAKIVADRDPLVVVLRGHLITELMVNEIYLTFSKLGAPKSQLREVLDATYKNKIKALYEGGMLPMRHYAPLKTLNRLRNRFAHLPLKTELDPADESRLLQSFTPEDQESIKAGVREARALKPHMTLTYCLLKMYVTLRTIVDKAREDAPFRFEDPQIDEDD